MAVHKRLKKTLLAVLVLIIPGICYMLLRTGTNFYHSLPVYGPDGKMALADSVPDSAWYRIADLPVLEDKMYVASFLRARASSQAETLAVNMMRLAKTYQDLDRLAFVAFIAVDSSEAPGSEAHSFEDILQQYGGDSQRWLRLPMSEAAVEKLIRDEFLFEPSGVAGTGRPLSDTLVLLDSHRRIRGYYDGSSYFATDTLEDEIAVLWKEEMNQDDQ